MLTAGTTLQNRYRILRQLGGGGMGTVYLAEDIRLSGRVLAVKEMSPQQVAAQDRQWATSAFRQEAEILARLQHPGIAAVTDFFPEGGNWYLVMEYVQGQTLSEVLETAPGKRLPEAQALGIFDQLVDVLTFLHTQSPPVVFRDLKPGNVMITPEGKVKLIDFGIARFFKPTQGRDTVNLGTPGYAAPEQYGGRGQSDVRADVYGLGVMLHQMLTGYDPTSTPFRLPPLESLTQGLPPHVAQAVRQATEHDPEARFVSVAHLRAAVRGDSRTAMLDEARTTPPGGIPRWVWGLIGGGAALVALAAVAVVAFFALGSKSEPTRTPLPVARATATPAPPTATAETRVVTEEPLNQLNVAPETVVVVVTATPPPATPTPEPPTSTPTPPPSAQIVFHASRGGNSDIYVVNIDGSDERRLTTDSGDDQFPAVSPDGERVVFQSNRDGNWEIYVMGIDGDGHIRLTRDDANDRLPNWSPDGRQILFVSDRDGNFEIYVMDASGGELRRLTHNTRRDGHASWSATGQIVFNAGQASDSSTWEIYVMNVNGGGERQLTGNSVNDWSPNWSPDGRRVLFLSRRLDDDPAIWEMNADGSGAQLVYNNPGSYEWGAVWSPDGRYVAFTSDVSGRDEVYVLDRDSGRATQLTTGGGMYPSWSP